MIHIIDKKDCCGCTACMSICKHNAITMSLDDMGFKYPIVDVEKCVECGQCEKICSFKEHYDVSSNYDIPLAFGVRHKCFEEIKTSRSGAMFIALSDYIFKNKGVVYGAGYGENFKVIHKRITNKYDCKELKGSKYVQSDLDKIFIDVKRDLLNGLLVLFVGTPCQTSGLKSFIGEKLNKNLYLCDIICHGVPSPLVWKDYICYHERKEGSKIITVNFRDKERGWTAHFESFVFQNGKKIIIDTFKDLFYKHLILRPSCSVCKFTNVNRPSDITIADFWGWEKANSTFNLDDMGCSLVFVNNEKGKSLFDSVLSDINFFETDIEKCMQPNLMHPSVFSPKYGDFWNDYKSRGFEFVIKKYGNKGIRHKIILLKNKIKWLIKSIIKK